MTVHLTDVADPVPANVDAVPVAALARRGGIYRHFLKRCLDVGVVLLAAPFVIPFMVVVAAIVASDGHSPFYRQERVGRNGRRFTMWKFRTMVPGADDLLQLHLDTDPAARKEWREKQKLSCDPRCTRIGRALRRSSLDELPQLINVLAGDMSLVGPRPMMPCQQSLYPGRAYYDLRPGITGFWQVSERNFSEFAERARYDDLYYTKLSLWTDIRVLFQTVAVVLRGTGC